MNALMNLLNKPRGSPGPRLSPLVAPMLSAVQLSQLKGNGPENGSRAANTAGSQSRTASNPHSNQPSARKSSKTDAKSLEESLKPELGTLTLASSDAGSSPPSHSVAHVTTKPSKRENISSSHAQDTRNTATFSERHRRLLSSQRFSAPRTALKLLQSSWKHLAHSRVTESPEHWQCPLSTSPQPSRSIQQTRTQAMMTSPPSAPRRPFFLLWTSDSPPQTPSF